MADGGVWTKVYPTSNMLPTENGTWTPGLTIGGSTNGITYDVQSGVYHTIGNIMFWKFGLQLLDKGSESGQVLVTGLPKTPASEFSWTYEAGGIADAWANTVDPTLIGWVYQKSPTLRLMKLGDTRTSWNSTIQNTDISNDFCIRISGWFYFEESE